VKNGSNYELHEESVVIDESIPADPEFTRNIEDFYRAKLREDRPYLDTVISTIPDRCYDGTEEAVRDRESDWGDLLADTMRKAFKGVTADVAVLNGGSIRIDDTICGRITFENLERTFAYETPVVLVKIKGADLKKFILEDSANSKRGDGRFLQVSGVSFRRDFSAAGSDRLKDLQLQSGRRSTSFADNKTYVVAVNKYIFDCGDGYKFRQSITNYIPAGADLRALTYAALKAQVKGKKMKQLVAGRIIDLPGYVKLSSVPAAKWQTLTASDRQCK
jgi:5'-nucleotidase